MLVLVVSAMVLSSSVQIGREAKRSISESESKRTLQGADAGLEEGLSRDFNDTVDAVTFETGMDEASGKFKIETKDGSNNLSIENVQMLEGDDIALEEVGSAGFTISWGRQGSENKAVLLITAIDSSNVARYWLVEGSNNINVNGAIDAPVSSGSYANEINRNKLLSNGYVDSEIIRIKVLGDKTDLKLECADCGQPVARKIIAQAENTEDLQGRNNEVYESLPMAPSVFDFALYAQDAINGQN
jgi:hypothetical protein